MGQSVKLGTLEALLVKIETPNSQLLPLTASWQVALAGADHDHDQDDADYDLASADHDHVDADHDHVDADRDHAGADHDHAEDHDYNGNDVAGS